MKLKVRCGVQVPKGYQPVEQTAPQVGRDRSTRLNKLYMKL